MLYRYRNSAAALCFLADLVSVAAVAWWMRAGFSSVSPPMSDVLVGAFVLGAFSLDGLYDSASIARERPIAARVLRGIAFSFALALLIAAVVPLGVGWPIALAALPILAWRYLFAAWLRRFGPRHRLLLIGTGKTAEELAQEIRDRDHLGVTLAGFLSFDPSEKGRVIEGEQVLGTASEVYRIAREQSVEHVVAADPDMRGNLDPESLLHCKTQSIQVEEAASFYEQLTGRIRVDEPRVSNFVFSDGFYASPGTLAAKRLLDIVIAAAGLVVLAPFFALVAVAIRLDSRGPTFYRQERVGHFGKPFLLWKFRSMRVDAEAGDLPLWAATDDDRVTRVGSVLRRFSLDELPQLWNILKGEMSVVGPRPEREHFVRKLRELSRLYEYRLVVRPGLTGWAQIRAPYASSYEHSLYKLSFDLYYVKRLSLAFDLSILFGTLSVVLFGRPPLDKADAAIERRIALDAGDR